MHQKLQAYLEEMRAEKRQEYEQEKQDTLLKLELYEKVYSPNDEYSTRFHLEEYDENSEKIKYYYEKAIPVTDEEYEELKACLDIDENKSTNSIAKAIYVIAIIWYVCGFIAGFILAIETKETGYRYETETTFNFALALAYWCTVGITGTMLLGFSEIINLLHKIKKKLR